MAIQRNGSPAGRDVLGVRSGRGASIPIASGIFAANVVCASVAWTAIGGVGHKVSQFAKLLVTTSL